MKSTTWMGAVAVAGMLAIAGCGGNDESSGGSGASSSSGSASGGSGSGSTLQLAADPSGKLRFDKTTLTAKAGTVTIDFTNRSSLPHAVAVEGNGVDKDGKTITGGKDTLTVKLEPGTYEFYCPVDGHRQAGMKGTLTVK